MSKLSIVLKQPLSAHFQQEKLIRNDTKAHFFQLTSITTYKYVLHH